MKTREIILKRIKKGTKAGEVTCFRDIYTYLVKNKKKCSRANIYEILGRMVGSKIIIKIDKVVRKETPGRPSKGYIIKK
jgi:hypothetical protein